jgi:phosphoenolpyruvate carboxylase
MSTQHPDNILIPDWCKNEIIDGEREIYEAYFAYCALGCHEVMWDAEGKDVDTRVVRKLLTEYADYFKENRIGERIFLTYRIPNPKIDAAEKKIVVETLQNIPVAHDVASIFYKEEVSPIFEVILPMTTSDTELIWLNEYYKKAIIAIEDIKLFGSVRIKEWIGPFRPKNIQVIPLVEDYESMMIIDKITKSYIKAFKPSYQRVFIARSDPALNYGLFSAIILSKIALSKLKILEKHLDISIHPILGAGSLPFRGHLSPQNLEAFLREYRGISTVTIQSSLRYDHPFEQVKDVVNKFNNELPNGGPQIIEPYEEKNLLSILNKSRKMYEKVIEDLANLLNGISYYIPQRRARKLHIGLFGYSRSISGVRLPRAIPFTAALYTLGIPPEIIGARFLIDLRENELNTLQKYYINMINDFNTVGGYFSWQNFNMLMDMYVEVAERVKMSKDNLKQGLTKLLDDIRIIEGNLGTKLGPRDLTQKKHENFINSFLISFLKNEDTEARTYLVEAAKLRKCLG